MKKKIAYNFDQWVDMCRAAAWKYAKSYGIDFDDCEAQAFLIYMEAIPRWKPEKATFSTFLTWRLKILGDYCKSQRKKIDTDEYGIDREAVTIGRERMPGLVEVIKHAVDTISADAVEILSWIVYRRWETRRNGKPSIITARRVFRYERDWEPERTDAAWHELSEFWTSGTAVVTL